MKTTSGSTSLTDTLKLALAGNGDKGETVSVEVTANDGLSDGNTATDSVLVANTAPTATVALAPAAPKTDELLTATATKADADGDGVTLTYVWKVDGATVKTTSGSASLTDTLDLAQAGNGDKGQTVSVEVTPNDGAAGAAATDSAVVANSTPVLSGVSIDQAAPRTNDTLTLTATATDADGDTLTPARQWRRNGSPIAGETGAALDLSLAGNGDKGDQLSVQLSVGDGTASSATLTSGAVTVLNSAPTVVSATIDQSAPKTNDAVAVAVVTADADGDARTSSFQWTKNGADRFGETASGYDLATILNGDKGDAIAVRVVASDGTESSAPVTSAAVTVANSAPVLDSVSIDQASPRTNDTLTLSATSHDDDGDAVSYAYQWRKNGLDLVSETSTSLDLGVAGNGDEGDAIAVRVTGSDGAGSSAPLLSNAVTVANTAPTATVSLAPASPTTNQTLTATATDADADGDAVTFTYLWKVDGSTVRTTAGSPGATDTLDLSQAGYGDKGQVVTVEVTPHDGDAAGSTVSDTTAVANSAPTISSVAIDQGSPATDEVLTVSIASADADGDARSYGYQWRRNGVDLAGETGATLDLAQAGHGDEGDAISVRITANDGSAASPASTSPAVTVGNSAPAIGSVTIDQAAPKTNDTLTVSVASSDSDGDGVGYTYQWRVDGIDVAGATGAALDLAQAGNGDKGDNVSVRVTATDGDDVSVPATSAPVTVQNTAPVVTVAAIDQASARTNDTLTATAATTDADGDAVTVTRQWTKNGLDRAGETAASFDLSQAGNGDKGDAIRVRVDATDGDDAAPAVTSAPLTISNTAPTAAVALTPAGPATDDLVTATVTTADADGDSVTLTYAWKVEGATVKTTSGSSSLTDTLDLALPGNGNGGDTVTVDATPDDGAAAGPTQSDALVVGFRPDHLTLTSATTDLASGSQRTLAVEVRDPDGALVAGDNSTQVTFAKSAGAGTVTGLGSATASGGTATLDVSAVLAGPITITATATGLAADSSGFMVVHGAPTQITLAESGSTASGDSHTLTATTRDAAGNPAVSDSSTIVSFVQTGGAGSVSGLGSATAASGVATHVVANGITGRAARGAGDGAGRRHGELYGRAGSGLDGDEHDRRLPHVDRRERGEHEHDHRAAEGHDRQRPRGLGGHRRPRPDRRREPLRGHRRRRRDVHGDAHLADDHRRRDGHGNTERRRARRDRRRHLHPRPADADLACRERLRHRRRHAHADGDDPGRERQHGHERQQHGGRIREDLGQRHGQRPRNGHCRGRRREQDGHEPACRGDRARRTGCRARRRQRRLHDRRRPGQPRRHRLDGRPRRPRSSTTAPTAPRSPSRCATPAGTRSPGKAVTLDQGSGSSSISGGGSTNASGAVTSTARASSRSRSPTPPPTRPTRSRCSTRPRSISSSTTSSPRPTRSRSTAPPAPT